MSTHSLDIDGELARIASGKLRTVELLQAAARLMALAQGSRWSQAAAYHGKALCALGRMAEGFATFEQAWERADHRDDAIAGALAARMAAGCCLMLYDNARAEHWCRRELDRGRSRTVINQRYELLDLLASALVSQGDLAGAREALAEFEGFASRHALLAYHEGDWERGVRLFREQFEHARSAGQLLAMANSGSVLGRLARVGSQRIEAQEYLDAALTISLEAPDLNRELFTRIELAILDADFGRISSAQAQLERCREILGSGEDWKGHRGSYEYVAALVMAADYIRKAKSSDEIWKAAGEKGSALKLPAQVAGSFRAAIETFRHCHAPWEEAGALIYWARAAFAASRHREAVEKNNLGFAIFERIGAPQFCERMQTAIFRFLTIDSRASSISMGDLRGSNLLQKEGDYWTISFQGAVLRLRDTLGMHYLSRLLINPGVEFSALELATSARKKVAGGAIRRASKRDENANGDAADEDSRDRRIEATRERARLMVTKRIKDVIAKIRASHPGLARHLATSIRTGHTCVYVVDPDQPQSWSI